MSKPHSDELAIPEARDYCVRVYDADAGGWTHAGIELIPPVGSGSYFSFYPDHSKTASVETVSGLDMQSLEANVFRAYRYMFRPMWCGPGLFKDDRGDFVPGQVKTEEIWVTRSEYDAMLARANALEAQAREGKLTYSISPFLGRNCGGVTRDILLAGLGDRPDADTLRRLPLAQRLVFLPSEFFARTVAFNRGMSGPSDPMWPVVVLGVATLPWMRRQVPEVLRRLSKTAPRTSVALGATALMATAALKGVAPTP